MNNVVYGANSRIALINASVPECGPSSDIHDGSGLVANIGLGL